VTSQVKKEDSEDRPARGYHKPEDTDQFTHFVPVSYEYSSAGTSNTVEFRLDMYSSTVPYLYFF